MMLGYFGGPGSSLGPIRTIRFGILALGGGALLLRSWRTPSRAEERDPALPLSERGCASGALPREDHAMRRDRTGPSR